VRATADLRGWTRMKSEEQTTAKAKCGGSSPSAQNDRQRQRQNQRQGKGKGNDKGKSKGKGNDKGKSKSKGNDKGNDKGYDEGKDKGHDNNGRSESPSGMTRKKGNGKAKSGALAPASTLRVM
jgi:hypothetical protein